MSITQNCAKLLLGALLLLIAGLCGAENAERDTWVFVDNSRSVKKLSSTYAWDMWNLLSRGEPKGNLYFSAIAPAAKQPWQLSSSDATLLSNDAKVQQVFDFNGQTTPIADSLARAETDPAFADIGRIVVISDMDPDHQFQNRPFNLQNRDLRDLKSTLETMDRWLGEGRKLDLVLHGWARIPNPKDYDSTALQGYPAKLQRQIDQGGSVANGKPLVSEGLAWLGWKAGQDANANRLRMRAIKTRLAGGKLNEEGFQLQLCDLLQQTLGNYLDLDVCGGASIADVLPADTPIGARFDVQRGMMTPRMQHILTDNWPDQLAAAGVPRAIAPPEIQIGGSDNRPDSSLQQLQFMLQGTDAGPRPFNYPRLTARGWSRSEGWKALRTSPPDRPFDNQEEMLHWAAAEAQKVMASFIEAYHPPATKLKKFWLTDTAGDPLPDGLHFKVIFDADGAQQSGNSTVASTRGGVVQLRIPVQFKDAQLLMVKPEAPYEALATAFAVTPEQVQSRQGIRGKVQGDNFTNKQSLFVCTATADDPETCDGEVPANDTLELQLYLKTGNDELASYLSATSADSDGRIRREGPNLIIERLVPGNYVADVRVRENPPRWLTSTNVSLNPVDSPDAILIMSPDRLANGVEPTYFKTVDDGRRLHPRSREYLRGSAYYLERLLQFTSEQLANDGDERELIALWNAIRTEVYGEGNSAGRTERYQKWLTPAMEPLGLTRNGKPNPRAMRLQHAMLNRFIGCHDQQLDRSASADFKRAYVRMIRQLRNAELINKPLYQRLMGVVGPGCRDTSGS
jgi:hypothetical protein